MSQGVVVIKKEFQGEEWVNTYAFTNGVPGTPEDADFDAIGMGLAFNNNQTNPSNAEFDAAQDLSADGSYLVLTLLAFERLLHFEQVAFTSIYVTDKLENSAVTDLGTNAFAVKPLALQGLRPASNGVPAPGNNALLVNRVPAGYSQRAGQLFYRGVLPLTSIAFLGRGLLDWSSLAARNTYANDFNQGVDNAEVSEHFATGASPWKLGIGKYRRGVQVPPLDEGDLVTVSPISGFRIQKPVSRQVKRGRREGTS